MKQIPIEDNIDLNQYVGCKFKAVVNGIKRTGTIIADDDLIYLDWTGNIWWVQDVCSKQNALKQENVTELWVETPTTEDYSIFN